MKDIEQGNLISRENRGLNRKREIDETIADFCEECLEGTCAPFGTGTFPEGAQQTPPLENTPAASQQQQQQQVFASTGAECQKKIAAQKR